MNNRQRFNNIMNCQGSDRILYFEEGIRTEVLRKWGITKSQFLQQFNVDFREEIIPEIDVKPALKNLGKI